MAKLPCGCTPDASGFGYCGECTRKLREKIWANMSEDKKKYDRHFAPDQSKRLDDVMDDYDNDLCCSCHISAPCSYCISKSEEENNSQEGSLTTDIPTAEKSGAWGPIIT